jgi:hypothetical protein
MQWQESFDRGATWSDITGETGKTYTRVAAPTDQGVWIRTEYVDFAGEQAVSEAARLTVSQCKPDYAPYPVTRTFNPGAAGWVGSTGGCLYSHTITWQKSLDFGVTWQNVPGVTGETLELGAVSLDDDLSFYRPVFTYGGRSMTGSVNIVRVRGGTCDLPKPMTSVLVGEGEPVRLWHYASTGCEGWTIRTESRTVTQSGVGQWTTMPGDPGLMGGVSMSTASEASNTLQYRTVLTNGSETISSPTATVTVRTGCDYLMADVPGSVMKAVGEEAEFAVSLNDECQAGDFMLRWQKSLDGGQTWQNIAGATGLELAHDVTAQSYWNLFRTALITSAGTIYSRTPAVIYIVSEGAPIETKRAIRMDSSGIPVGEGIVLSAQAMGQEEPSIQWVLRTPNGSGGTIETAIQGETGRVLDYASAEPESGYLAPRYTNSSGTTLGSSVPVTFYIPLTFSVEEAVLNVSEGDTVVLMPPMPNDERAVYPDWPSDWERAWPGGSFANDTGTDRGSPLTFVATSAYDGARFRVWALQAYGGKLVYSPEITVNVM